MTTLDQKTIDAMVRDADFMATYPWGNLTEAQSTFTKDAACHIKALACEIETVKRTRDELLGVSDAFQLAIRSALGCPDDGVPFVEHIKRLREEVAAIKRDIPKLHKRKCWPCQVVHWNADDHGKAVDCPVCGSRDTRRVDSKPTGGTMTFESGGRTSPPLPFNASVEDIESAIGALLKEPKCHQCERYPCECRR